jgi:hypothetical protein
MVQLKRRQRRQSGALKGSLHAQKGSGDNIFGAAIAMPDLDAELEPRFAPRRWCECSCDFYLCSLHSALANLTINIHYSNKY